MGKQKKKNCTYTTSKWKPLIKKKPLQLKRVKLQNSALGDAGFFQTHKIKAIVLNASGILESKKPQISQKQRRKIRTNQRPLTQTRYRLTEPNVGNVQRRRNSLQWPANVNILSAKDLGSRKIMIVPSILPKLPKGK